MKRFHSSCRSPTSPGAGYTRVTSEYLEAPSGTTSLFSANLPADLNFGTPRRDVEWSTPAELTGADPANLTLTSRQRQSRCFQSRIFHQRLLKIGVVSVAQSHGNGLARRCASWCSSDGPATIQAQVSPADLSGQGLPLRRKDTLKRKKRRNGAVRSVLLLANLPT